MKIVMIILFLLAAGVLMVGIVWAGIYEIIDWKIKKEIKKKFEKEEQTNEQQRK